MQSPSCSRDTSIVSLGHRRGVSDLAHFALDLTWARAESDSTARSRDYPSPPMSGSPPLPPKANLEAGDQSQGNYQPVTQDVYRGGSSVQADIRAQQGVRPAPPIRPYAAEPERLPYPFRRPEEASPRPLATYNPPHPQMMPQHPYLPAPGPGQAPAPQQPPVSSSQPPPYSISNRPAAPLENPAFPSPKTQRKTKGHVASACVPCKKAHLRCDSQRPCSRCLSNGKEDACVDVQHKKRGRPRLRDDKDATRYDPRFSGQPDALRRPMPLYSTGPMGTSYEDPLRRNQSYRVLKSQPTESMPPRFLDRASAADANIYPPPLAITPWAQEPVAFLTMDLEIAKASQSFSDAIGIQSVVGRRLFDIISANDRDKASRRHREMQEDQRQRDPRYLPPIFGKEEAEKVIRSLTFSPEQIARFQLEKQEHLTFQATDGQQRTYSVRMGVAKQDSIYFIVLVLNTAPPPPPPPAFPPYPSPSPHARDIPYSYQPTPQHGFSQPTPVSASFEIGRPRFGDGGYGPSPSPRQHQPPHGQLVSGLSPSLQSYPAPSTRMEYPTGPSSYQIPRSELTPTTRAPAAQAEFQLPPIRSQPQPSTAPAPDSSWPRDERSGRVDIGGLIEKPDPTARHQ